MLTLEDIPSLMISWVLSLTEKSWSVRCEIYHVELYIPTLVISTRQKLQEVVVSFIRKSDLVGENRQAVCIATPSLGL